MMNNILRSETVTRDFIEKLRTELLTRLPGVEAHLRLAPEIRKIDLKNVIEPKQAMESAVLILLYPVENRLHTVVILRNEYDGPHSGQISLPGGKYEESDIDFLYTAIRESQEEIGINPSDIEIVGQLSRFYVRPSNFIVYPFIAYQSFRPDFHPDPTEVQRIIEIDVFKELNLDKIVNRTLSFKNDIKVYAPGFSVGGEFLWGATAMIMSELIYVLDQVSVKLESN
jgi:8-oxo-dGTP pyrophosphatase MutT (NUDIX family)